MPTDASQPPEITRPLAATSWLWPGTIEENLLRIADLDLPVRQVALLFYRFRESLAMLEGGLPAPPGLTCHAHLPVDLPWEQGSRAVYAVIERLMAPPGGLAPWAGVLHPPADPADLAGVASLWRKAAPGWTILIENVPSSGLEEHWPVIRDLDLSLCLDVGHLMAFGQHRLLDAPDLGRRVELLHVYAPGTEAGTHHHLALSALTAKQEPWLRRCLEAAGPETTLLFEVFSEIDLRDSLETLYKLHARWGTSA